MVGLFSWLTPVLIIGGVVLVAVVVGLIWRGRDGADGRPGPVTYFLYGLSLVCLVVMLVGAGIAVHATAQAIGPTSPNSNLTFRPVPALCYGGQHPHDPAGSTALHRLRRVQRPVRFQRPSDPSGQSGLLPVARIRFISWITPPLSPACPTGTNTSPPPSRPACSRWQALLASWWSGRVPDVTDQSPGHTKDVSNSLELLMAIWWRPCPQCRC